MRIAHFSDLHLLSLAGARVLDFANKRWIGGLNLLTNRGRHYHSHIFEAMVEDINEVGVDHVVCTGDLTNLAFEQEFRFARERFDRLSLSPRDITVVPGNHDTYVAAGADYFREVFADHHEGDAEFQEAGDAGDAQSSWPVVRVRGPVVVIGLCSSRKTPWFTAYGQVGKDQLDRLRAILGDERLAKKFRLVVLHHPPAGRAARSKLRGLRDFREVCGAIAEGGAELVLHGHEHRDMLNHIEDIEVLGVQSGTYLANHAHRTARYRILDIDVAPADASDERPRLSSHRLRMWSPEREAFIDDPGAQAA